MVERGKACVDEQELLWYAARALGEEDIRRIGEHVSGCRRCQGLVSENEEIADAYRRLAQAPSLHPEPAVLSALADGRFAGTTARDHLTECRECQEIVSVVQTVNREIDEPAVREPARKPAMLLWLRWAPGYLLALLLLYPAYRGTVGESKLEAPRLLASPFALPSEGERGPGSPAIRFDGRGPAVLTFFVPISNGHYRYEVELLDSAGKRRLSDPDARSFDGRGTFTLLVPQGALGPGDYQVRVLEKEGNTTASVFTFPFRVEK